MKFPDVRAESHCISVIRFTALEDEPSLPSKLSGIVLKLKVNFEIYVADRKATTCI